MEQIDRALCVRSFQLLLEAWATKAMPVENTYFSVVGVRERQRKVPSYRCFESNNPQLQIGNETDSTRRCDVIGVFIAGIENNILFFSVLIFIHVLFGQVKTEMNVHICFFRCTNLNSCLCRTAIRHSFAGNMCLSIYELKND